MRDGALRCVYVWGVGTAGILALIIYGALWASGAGQDDFVTATIVLAFVSLSPGCLILGWGESGMEEIEAASEAGVVLGADTRRRATASLGSTLLPLGFVLTGVGIYGILITALVVGL
jgi:hypothetical protein